MLRGGAYLYIEKPIRYDNLKNVFETLEKDIMEEKPSDDLERVMFHIKSSTRISFARLAEYSEINSDLRNIYHNLKLKKR